MKIRRLQKLGLFVGLLAMSLATAGCSSGNASDGKQAGEGRLVKVSIAVSSQTPTAQVFREYFKPRLEELTDGKYDIQLYDSGMLGNEKVTYDYTKNGIIELAVVGTPMWSETPKMAISDFPFVFRDVEHARNAYQGELGEFIEKDIEASQPVQLLSWFPNGARAFSSNKKLASVDDFKGQKLRMPNNPIHVKLAESLGSNVVIMDLGEVFTALEQGVVDGQDNPLSTVRNEGWYEVQDNIYNTNHIIASLELFASDDFWESIDEADREIFQQVADETSDKVWDLYIGQLQEDIDFMKEQGITVTDLSEADREAMIKKIQPVYDYLDSQYDWAEDVRQMIADIE